MPGRYGSAWSASLVASHITSCDHSQGSKDDGIAEARKERYS